VVLVEQSKVVTRSCRAVSAELIRRVKCCRKDMQRFIVPMEKSSLVERRPARQRHGIKCQPHKKCQMIKVAYLQKSLLRSTPPLLLALINSEDGAIAALDPRAFSLLTAAESEFARTTRLLSWRSAFG